LNHVVAQVSLVVSIVVNERDGDEASTGSCINFEGEVTLVFSCFPCGFRTSTTPALLCGELDFSFCSFAARFNSWSSFTFCIVAATLFSVEAFLLELDLSWCPTIGGLPPVVFLANDFVPVPLVVVDGVEVTIFLLAPVASSVGSEQSGFVGDDLNKHFIAIIINSMEHKTNQIYNLATKAEVCPKL
jgi:hypothetical protein